MPQINKCLLATTLSVAFASLTSPLFLSAQGIIQSVPEAIETDWAKPGFWQTTDGRPVEESWEFTEGEIRLVKPRGGKGSLVSGPLPAHFELSWQWKIEAKTNSGIKYRVRKFDGRYLGLEYQIIDYAPGSARAKSTGGTAAIYDLVPPIADLTLHPPGQWNRSRIVAIGDRVEHYLNGTLTAKMTTRGPAWDAKFAISKYWGADRFAQPTEGDRVMLTDHGGKVTYKDFEFVIRQAPQAAPLTRSPPFLGNAMRNGWADQNSIVIWTRTTAEADMITSGPKFQAVSKSEVAKLSQTTDVDQLHAAQIPRGAKLREMFGACPGAAGEVRLTYFIQRQSPKSTDWKRTTADQDFTAQWKLDNLIPGKEYAAVIEARPVGGDAVTAVVRGAFRTAPKQKDAVPVKFCMTTCHDFYRRDDGLRGHKIYPAMTAIDPDFVVHAGDIEYYDKPEPWAWTIELMRFKWARIFSLPANREFYSRTTSYFLKDDHDTLKNDCWAGQSYGAVSFQQGVALFNEEQFPAQSPRYKMVSWGKELDVWFLEGRDYRSPNNMPDGPDKTILGKEQKAWLAKTLTDSNATFKLVFSPTPIVGPDRANKKDNHANEVFLHEGNELRELFAQAGQVIVFCGDRHWQYASVDPQTSLWEFGCGPGSEKHQFGWKPGDQRPQHEFLRVAGGFLSGQLSYGKGKQPTLTIRHHEVSGKQVSEFAFPTAWANQDGSGTVHEQAK
jgi:alkaline phosphatase D